ncbi:hypothetical protein CCHR01_11147 [Colletotrichum chrysophilum]|uniref:Uncharacterized protein n=1 Tax=Colletotrichum chrysophilum TaxID=1836956 RepID=A0AAD9ADR6_9PEZI|nr:hypothetical protein CCHR01_11147 [Colletotrichum chrysophilum]
MRFLAVCVLALVLVVLVAAETTSASLKPQNKFTSNGPKKGPETHLKSLRVEPYTSCRYGRDKIYRIIANRVPLEKMKKVCKTFEDHLRRGKCGYMKDKANFKCGYGGIGKLDIMFNAQGCHRMVVREAWRVATGNTYGEIYCGQTKDQHLTNPKFGNVEVPDVGVPKTMPPSPALG